MGRYLPRSHECMTVVTPEPVRLAKLMAERGLASRGEADRMIARGWVRVNGRVAQSGERALPDARIELSAEADAQRATATTVVLHKPRGFTSAADETGGASVIGLLTSAACRPERAVHRAEDAMLDLRALGLRVAGRLAVDDTGLVVFTSDSALARRLSEPATIEQWNLHIRSRDGTEDDTRIAQALRDALPQLQLSAAAQGQWRVVTPALRKGQWSALADARGWVIDALRVARGEVTLGDQPEATWRVWRSPHAL